MLRTTSITLIVLLLVAVCFVSFQLTSDPTGNSGYTEHWMRSEPQMMRADGGGSKVRFIDSPSASQYDVEPEAHIGQIYMGATRKQFDVDLLKTGHPAPEVQQDFGERRELLQMPIADLMNWLRMERKINTEPYVRMEKSIEKTRAENQAMEEPVERPISKKRKLMSRRIED